MAAGCTSRSAERGDPLLFIHEFAGDHRSWNPQVGHFESSYRCIVYAARGYPPSDVPGELESYSQARAVQDALTVLDGLGIEQAHVVGLSMGGFCALHLGLQAPARTRSLVVAGCGYGAAPEAQERFRRESTAIAGAFRTEGAAAVAPRYAVGPARVQLQNRNPRRVGAVRAQPRRALVRGRGPDDARRSEPPALAVRDARPAHIAARADADPDR